MDAQPFNRFERRKQRTREVLKQAAIDLILEKGYEAVTVDEITTRADVGRGTIYIHFQDKDDILWSIVKDVIVAGDVEANNRYLIERPTHAEYLGVRLLFEYASQRRDLYRLMLGQRGSAALSSKLQDVIAAEIEREIKQSRVFKGIALPSQFTAQFVTGALVRLLTWWLETPNAYTVDQMADMFYALLNHEPPGR
jgi:AcrR family transcriptional regulator